MGVYVTGHKTREVFDRYNIVSPSETSGAVAKLAAFLSATECHKTGTNGAGKALEAKGAELTK